MCIRDRPRRAQAGLRISVVQRAEHRARRIDRPVGRPQALHPATLLVDQHGGIGIAHRVSQLNHKFRDLCRTFNISLEQNEAPGLLLTQKRELVSGKDEPGDTGDEGARGHALGDSPHRAPGSRKRRLIPLDDALSAGGFQAAAEL